MSRAAHDRPAALRQLLDEPAATIVAADATARAMPGLARFFGREHLDLSLDAGRTGWRLCGERADGDNIIYVEPGLLPQVSCVAGDVPFLADITLDDLGLRQDAAGESRFERNVIECAQRTAPSSEVLAILGALRRSPAMPALDLPMHVPSAADGAVRVLVIDQQANEASIALSGASEATFSRLVEAAKSEYPGCEFWLAPARTGAKTGFLHARAARLGLNLLPFRPDPAEAARLFEVAYVVSDAYGWDLLVQGLKVRCLAMPFYAGWGLTRDDGHHPRRGGLAVAVTHLIEAGIVQAGLFINPCTSERSTPVESLEIGRDVARQRRMNAGLGVFHHILGWKRDTIAAMFAPDHTERRFYNGNRASVGAAARLGRPLVSWASGLPPALLARAEAAHVPVVRMEDGFIRSVGLGAAGYAPLSLVLDDIGIYYDCTRPSRLETILQNADFDAALLDRARALIVRLVQANVTKYNLAERQAALDLPAGRRVVFVPGQVEDDASILLGGEGMTAQHQLAMVRERAPDAVIIYKPHPDVSSGLRKGLADKREALRHADLYVEDVSVLQLLALCDEVHTITSLTGFEALLRGKAVTCYGSPFYAGWGLTHDLTHLPRRNRRLSLEALVAGTLILYPHYLDPVSGLHASPEVAIDRIAAHRLTPTRQHAGMRLRALFHRLRRQWLKRRA